MSKVMHNIEAKTPKSSDMYSKTGEVLAQEIVDTVTMPYPIYIHSGKGSKLTLSLIHI